MSLIRNTTMSSSLSDISIRDLKKAVVIRQRIETLEQKLAAILGEAKSTTRTSGGRGGRRTMSPAARARIAAAQRLRWARQRGESVPTAAGKPRKRRRMSASARARISAIAKARWAKAKAKGQTTLAA
jgi:hypothetical protein